MIKFDEFTLDNGLRVIVHRDTTVPTVAFNLLYNVGSRDEQEDKTGFAHLFEHLMFGGSVNIPDFDTCLQRVGGDNNAFTSTDVTNYYITLPANNIETAFWLESDRMLGLNFDQRVLDVEKNVVIEEFKQHYLNQPYGEAWLKLRPLAYKVHPYKWATIGKDIAHIEKATMDDVKDFFFHHYAPNNAILTIAGNIDTETVKRMSDKWFGVIPARTVPLRNLPKEPKQTEARKEDFYSNVPAHAIYKVYHMSEKTSPSFYPTDLLSDALGRGKSSILYEKLTKENPIFSSISAYVLGSADTGLLCINGKVSEGISIATADNAIEEVLQEVIENGLQEEQLQKAKNQAEATLIFSEMEILNRAMNLAQAALLGNANDINTEAEKIQAVTLTQINQIAKEVLLPTNCSTLYYHSTLQTR